MSNRMLLDQIFLSITALLIISCTLSTPASPTPTLYVIPTYPPTSASTPTKAITPTSTATATIASTTSSPTDTPTPTAFPFAGELPAGRIAFYYQVNEQSDPTATPEGAQPIEMLTGQGIALIDPKNGAIADMGIPDVNMHTARVAWSPDGKRFGLVYDDDLYQALMISDVDDAGNVLESNQVFSENGYAARLSLPSFSPDGTQFAFTGEGGIWIATFDSREMESIPLDFRVDGTVSWSPDGKTLMFDSEVPGTNQHAMYLVDINGENLKSIGSFGNMHHHQWSPDGARIAFIAGASENEGSRLVVMDANGGHEAVIANTFDFEWSPDGQWLLYSGSLDDRQGIIRTSADGSVSELIDSPMSKYARDLGWSPDGQWIIYSSTVRETEDPTLKDFEIYITNISSGETIQLTNNDYEELYPVWQPDPAFKPALVTVPISENTGVEIIGQIAFAVEGINRPSPIYIADVEVDYSVPSAQLTNITMVYDRVSDAEYLAWSPDGSKLLFNDGYYGMYMLDFGNGTNRSSPKLVPLIPGHGRVYSTTWSPDGASIVYVSSLGLTRFSIADAPITDTDQLEFIYNVGTERDLGGVDWSPDGRYILYQEEIDDRPMTFLFDMTTLTPSLLIDDSLFYAVWSNDGRVVGISYYETNPQFTIVTLSDRSIRYIGHSGYQLDWSPDNQWLIYVSADLDTINEQDIYITNIDDGFELRLTNTVEFSTDDNEASPVWRP